MSTVLVFLFAFLWTTANAWSPYPLYENTLYDYTRPQPQFLNKSELSFNLGDPEDFRIAVYEKCLFQFDGAWKLITPQQMIFYPLRRSIRDRWYYCGLPSGVKPIYREYSEAVVIFYGPGRRHPERTNTVSAVSAYLSEKQFQQYSTLLTPRILGTFPGGRIEEYWQQFRVSSNKDIPLIAEEVIRKLAYIHGLTPPAPRSIDHFWHEVSTYISIIRRGQYSQHLHKHLPKQKKILFEIQSYNFEAEALWLRSYLDEIRTPIVFSHGNPRAERILLRKVAGGDNMTFLDLGWGRYLYRGYDLADFFLEGAILLDRSIPYPHFKVDPNWVPVPKRLDELVELYLLHITPLERDWPSIENTKERLLEEMERATLLSHFYNAVHSLFNSYFDFGKMFGFPEYSRKRLEMYFLFKKQIIEQKGLKIPLFAKKFLPNDLIDRGYPGARNIGPHDRLYLDPFFISSDSISGYLYPQSFVTNGLDLELCRRMSRNSGFYPDQYPSAYSNYFEPNIGPLLQNNNFGQNYAGFSPINLSQINQQQQLNNQHKLHHGAQQQQQQLQHGAQQQQQQLQHGAQQQQQQLQHGAQQQQQLQHGAQQQQQLHHGAQQQQQQSHHGAQQQQQQEEQIRPASDINQIDVWRHLGTTYKRAPIPQTGQSGTQTGA